MALDIRVKATLDKNSISTLQEQIKAAGKGVKLQLGVNKSTLRTAVNEALKSVNHATLTISKIKFSADAQKQMTKITRYYRDMERAASGDSQTNDMLFSFKKANGLIRVTKYWRDNQFALNEYKQSLDEVFNLYNRASTPKELQLAEQHFKNVKSLTDEVIKTEQQRAQITERTDKMVLMNAEKKAEALRKYGKQLQEQQAQESKNLILQEKLKTLQNNIATYFGKNVSAAQKYRAEIAALNEGIRKAIETNDQAKFRELSARFAELKSRIRAAGDETEHFGSKMKFIIERFRGFITLSTGLMVLRREFRKAYDAIAKIDSAMINLKKVTDESEGVQSAYLTRAEKQAVTVGRTVSGLVEQTATWAKLGFSVEEAEKLSQISSVFANVADLSDEDAVKDLVTAMKAFNIEASDAMQIADKLNELGNNFATDAASLGEGLAKSASALRVAGNDINETLAMITGGTEITQDAGNLANSLKVISMRIRGMKGELEELGEEYENVESISKIQTQILNLTSGKVNIFKDDGSFKSTYEILQGISEVYDYLSDTSKATLTEILFGKVRANQGVALINAFQSGQVQKAYETAVNSSGSAMREQERWLTGIEAKQQQLAASWERFYNDLIGSDFFKTGLEIARSFIDVLDALINKLGTLPTILAGVVGAKSFNVFSQLLTVGGQGVANGFKENINRFFNQLTASEYKNRLKDLVDDFNGLKEGQDNWVAGLTESEEPLQGYFKTVKDGSANVEDLTQYVKENNIQLQGMGASSKIAALGMNLLKTAASAFIGMAVSLAISKIIEGIKYLITAEERAHEAAVEATNSISDFTETADDIDESISQFESLRKKVSDTTISFEEYTSAKNDLLELQESLIEQFGDEADGISLVNGEYESQLELLRSIKAEKANEWLDENRSKINTIEEDTSFSSKKLLKNYASYLDKAEYNQYEKVVVDFLKQHGYTSNVLRELTGEQAYATANEIGKLLDANSNYFEKEGKFVYDAYKGLRDEADQIITKNREAYTEYEKGQRQLEKQYSFYGAYSTDLTEEQRKGFTNLLDVVEQINKVAESGDLGGFANLRNILFNYEEWFSEMESNVPESFAKAWNNALNNIDAKSIDKASRLERVLGTAGQEAVRKGIKGIELTDFLSGELNGYEEQTIEWYDHLKSALESSGLELRDFADAFGKVGIIAGYVAQDAEDAFTQIRETVEAELENTSKINEVLSSGNTLTIEQYKEMIGVSTEYASALRMEADGIRFDSTQVRQLTKQRLEDKKATLEEARSQAKLEYAKLHKNLKTAIGDYKTLTKEKIELHRAEIDGLVSKQKEITQYDLLIEQIDEATNSLNNYAKAKSEAAYSAYYNTASDAYKSIEQGFETSKIGTKEFEAAVEALVPKDVIDNGIDAIYEYYQQTLEQYFKYDDSGNILRESLENFVQNGIASGVFSGTLDEWVVTEGKSLQEIADSLHITKDAVISFFGALEEYGYGVNFTYFDELVESIGNDVLKLQELEDQLLASGDITGYMKVVEQEQKAAKEMADNLLNQEQVMQDLENANQELRNMIETGATENEIAEQINHIQELKDKLVEPSEINITIAKNEIESEITELQQQLSDALAGDTVADIRGADEIRAQIAELEGKKTELEAMLELDTSDAEEKLKEIKDEVSTINSLLNKNNTISIDTSTAQSKINHLISLMRTFRGLANTTITTDGSFDDVGNRTGAPRGFAKGTMGSNYSGNALVGELGAEMLVRGNSWHLLGAGGAEFANIRKGDIIFDANQTRHLLSNGRINSRGKSFVNGTFGRAFDKGVQGGGSFRNFGSTKAEEEVAESISNAADAIEDAAEKNSEYIDEIEILISRVDDQIKRLETVQELYETYRNQNAVIDKNMALQAEKIGKQQLAYDKYMRQAMSVGLDREWMEKVMNGGVDITEITDEDLKKKIDEFKQWYEKAEDAKNSINEINKELHDLSVQKLENITNDFELVNGHLEAIISKQKAIIELNQRMGVSVTESDYQEIIAEQSDITNYLRGELEQLEKELQNQLDSGAIVKYDDCWWEWKTNIEGIKESIVQSDSAVLDLVENVRKIRWQGFEDAVTNLEDLDAELKDVQNLIGNAELFNDYGGLTQAGVATLGSQVQQLGSAKSRAAEYENAIKALNGDLANGNISQDEYNKLLKEYTKAQRKAVADTKATEDAIISLKIKGIDKATEAYRKYIDIQKEDLRAKKEYDDYLDKVNDKTDEMNAIRSQISALQGDEKNATKIKKLNSQLLKLTDEYNDIRKDHEYEMLVEGYDKQLELFEQNQEDEKYLLENDLAYRKSKIDEEALQIKNSYADVYEYIKTLGDTYKQPISDGLTSPWTSAQNAAQLYKQAVIGIASSVHIEVSKINNEMAKIKNTTPANEKKGDVAVASVTGVGASNYVSSQPTPVKSSATPTSSGSGTSKKDVDNAPYVSVTTTGTETLKDLSKAFDVSEEDIKKKNKGSVKGVSTGSSTTKIAAGTLVKVPLTSRAHYVKSTFASGGIIEMAHRLGEDGIAFVRNGEAIIAPDQVNAVKTLAENASSLNNLVEKLPDGSIGGTINISYGSLINEYNAAVGDNSREVTQLFRKLFDNEMKRIGNYSRQLGLI